MVAAQAAAEGELREALKKKPVFHTRGGPVNVRHCREHCASYVSTVVFALASELCKAARVRVLSVDEIAECVEEFIHKLTVHAYYDFKLESAWSRWEFFRDEMNPAILQSDDWREHLRERAEVADLVGAESTNSPDLSVGQSASSDKDKPTTTKNTLAERERLSLLRVIRALANEAGIDISMTTKTGESISAMTELLGIRVAPRTISGYLKKIKEELERPPLPPRSH